MASIELKSISCKGVKSLVIFQKPSLYAVVSLSSGDKKNKKKTPVDRTNGENPEWDQPIRLDIGSRDPDLILQFDLKAEAILGNRLVGKARIPVADLDFSGSIQHASYQLRTPDGKPNGVLNFSYWIEAPGQAAAVPAQVPALTPVVNYSPPSASASVMNYSPPSAPAPVMNCSPPLSAPAPVMSNSPPPSAGFYPDVSYPPSAPPVPVSASEYYPYPAVDPVAVYPPPPSGPGYYPLHDSTISYPPPPSGPGYYPPHDSTISYPPPPSGPGYYPPHDSTISYPPPPVSAAADYYPPPPPAAGYYPPPGKHIAAYPPPQPTECQQVPECCDRSLPQPAPGWGYPPQPAPGWGYPPQPAPCCYSSPAPGVYGSRTPDVYGYQQDRGLYGYN